MSAAAPKAPSLPYHLRRYMTNQKNVPKGHFSVLNEIILALVGPLEAAGYTLPESVRPDISEGQLFAKWLRDEKMLDTDAMPNYWHEFEDGRRPVLAKAYPNDLLADFRAHFIEQWLPFRSELYFKQHDIAALAFLPKLLPPSMQGIEDTWFHFNSKSQPFALCRRKNSEDD
jgi:hypothetical protein